MNDLTIAAVNKAQGYLDLGLHEEAWAVLDRLESQEQRHQPVLELLVLILIAAKSWRKAEILAGILLETMPSNSGLWYALAQAQAQLGKSAEAKRALQRACDGDESLKSKGLEDPLLDGIW